MVIQHLRDNSKSYQSLDLGRRAGFRDIFVDSRAESSRLRGTKLLVACLHESYVTVSVSHYITAAFCDAGNGCALTDIAEYWQGNLSTGIEMPSWYEFLMF